MPRLLRLIVPCLAASLALCAHAAVDDIAAGTPLPRFALLHPGTHHYLRYLRDTATGANQPVDIWTRAIRFEQRDGQPRLHVVQRWDAVFPAPSVRTIDSWFETATFRPLTHERVTEKDGKRTVEGFVFAPERITGMRDLADNTQKDLVVASSEPTNNFETDIEFLQALPLADGYAARINFYHPGGSTPPQRYTFKVTGSQTIAGPAGPVDCWVVTTDYNTPGGDATFWFAKGSQVMVREESLPRDGKVLVKTLID